VANKNYVQIINERNLARLEKFLDKDKIAFGGAIDREMRTISPTLLKDVSLDDAVMQEEIFGPILPLISYTLFDEVLHYIQDHEKPLSAYLFSNNKAEQHAWLNELSFGGGCINDAIMHITNPNLPFGGVGQSGTGSYHGKAGFETFSHLKSVFEKPRLFEVPLKYPPYTTTKMGWIKRLLKLS
jgi:aldehyde dehydrogenase (NAD+)